MKIIDLLGVMGSYDKLIQVGYTCDGKYKKSGIIKVGNINCKQIDHWMFNKHVGMISPCVDKMGRKFLFVTLWEDEKE